MKRLSLALLFCLLAFPASAQIFSSGNPSAPMNPQIVTQSGSVTVPSNWHSTANDVYVFGCPGRGGHSLANTYAGGGSGGGAFVHLHNLVLTPSSTIQVQVCQGDDQIATWIKNNSGTIVLSADYGRSATGQTGGAGATCGASTYGTGDCFGGGTGANGVSLGANTGMFGSTGGSIGTLAGAGLNGTQPQSSTIAPTAPGCGSVYATQGGGTAGFSGAGIFGNGNGLNATAMIAPTPVSHCAGGTSGYPVLAFLSALNGASELFWTNGPQSIGPQAPGGASAAIAGVGGLGTPGNGAGGAVSATLDQAGGNPTPGFIVMVNAPFPPITIGSHLTLTGLQANFAEPVVYNQAVPIICTATRTLTDGLGRTVIIGYAPNFGGGIQCITTTGYGYTGEGNNIVVQGGGRGTCWSFRDNLHGGYWNPTICGVANAAGTPTYIDTSGSTDNVREFAIPLFLNNFDFTENNQMVPNPPFCSGGACPDADMLPESPLTGGNLTQDSEIRSEFDAAMSYTDITSGNVAGLQADSVLAYLQNPTTYPPGAVWEFGSAPPLGNPANKGVVDNVGNVVYQPGQFTAAQISPNVSPSQATQWDMSAMGITHGFRLNQTWFKYAMYSTGNGANWTVIDLSTGATFDCLTTNDVTGAPIYTYTTGKKIATGIIPQCGPNQTGFVDGNLFYLSTSNSPSSGFAEAVQFDSNAALNSPNQCSIYKTDGTVAHAEPRLARSHVMAHTGGAGTSELTIYETITGERYPGEVANEEAGDMFDACYETVKTYFGVPTDIEVMYG